MGKHYFPRLPMSNIFGGSLLVHPPSCPCKITSENANFPQPVPVRCLREILLLPGCPCPASLGEYYSTLWLSISDVFGKHYFTPCLFMSSLQEMPIYPLHIPVRSLRKILLRPGSPCAAYLGNSSLTSSYPSDVFRKHNVKTGSLCLMSLGSTLFPTWPCSCLWGLSWHHLKTRQCV